MNTPLRIGLDIRCLTGPFTGDRTYWHGLLTGLARLDHPHRIMLLTDREPEPGTVPDDRRMEICATPAPSGRWWSLVTLPRMANRRLDLVHVQYSASPMLRIPYVTTVHDISFRAMPHLFRPVDRWLLNHTVPAAVRRAHAVITVSEFSRQEILSAYAPSPERVVATPLATGAHVGPIPVQTARDALQRHYELRRPFVLMVGVLQPRKNLKLAVRAFAAVSRRLGDHWDLLIVGKPGWGQDELHDVIQAEGIASRVRQTGHVPDAYLSWFYSAADVLLYPSLYEGFGLPPLEAMACGCPVLASDIPPVREVVADAGRLLPPTQEAAWTDALAAVLNDPGERSRMRNAGRRRAAGYSWERMARCSLDVYETVGRYARGSQLREQPSDDQIREGAT